MISLATGLFSICPCFLWRFRPPARVFPKCPPPSAVHCGLPQPVYGALTIAVVTTQGLDLPPLAEPFEGSHRYLHTTEHKAWPRAFVS